MCYVNLTSKLMKAVFMINHSYHTNNNVYVGGYDELMLVLYSLVNYEVLPFKQHLL